MLVDTTKNDEFEIDKIYWGMNGNLNADKVKDFFEKLWGSLSQIKIDSERGQMVVYKKVNNENEAVDLIKSATLQYVKQPWYHDVVFDFIGALDKSGNEYYNDKDESIEDIADRNDE